LVFLFLSFPPNFSYLLFYLALSFLCLLSIFFITNLRSDEH
jgi:hypothetical protein